MLSISWRMIAQALFHLLQSHEISGIDVAGGHDRDFEIDGRRPLPVPVVLEAEIRLILADVARARRRRGPSGRSGSRRSLLPRVIAPTPLVRSMKMRFLFSSFSTSSAALGIVFVDELLHHPLEDGFIRQIHVEPPYPRPTGVEALAGHVFDDVVDHFAFVEAVKERGERAQIQPRRADAKQMRLDPPQLASDRAQHLASRRQFDPHQLFGRAMPRQFVVDRRGIIHPIDDRDVLVVIEVLAELFEAAVQIADVRRALDDAFAVEFQDEAQRRVGRGVLRAEIQRPAISATLRAFRKQFRRRLLERVRHKFARL